MRRFVLPQIMASAQAAMEDIKVGQKNGVDLGNWRAVITMMIGRMNEQKVLDAQGRRNIEMSWQGTHWFGLAVFKRAYHLMTEGGFASKLLACSMREGPLVAGKMRFWDVRKDLRGRHCLHLSPVRAWNLSSK